MNFLDLFGLLMMFLALFFWGIKKKSPEESLREELENALTEFEEEEEELKRSHRPPPPPQHPFPLKEIKKTEPKKKDAYAILSKKRKLPARLNVNTLKEAIILKTLFDKPKALDDRVY